MNNRPSEYIDLVDMAFDIQDYMIDNQNLKYQTEIEWLHKNYSNREALVEHFIKLYPVGEYSLRYQYLNQLSNYTLSKLQEMANIRANLLYDQYVASQKRKRNHSALKPLVKILKLMGR